LPVAAARLNQAEGMPEDHWQFHSTLGVTVMSILKGLHRPSQRWMTQSAYAGSRLLLNSERVGLMPPRQKKRLGFTQALEKSE
jgi:hypothetical protein